MPLKQRCAPSLPELEGNSGTEGESLSGETPSSLHPSDPAHPALGMPANNFSPKTGRLFWAIFPGRGQLMAKCSLPVFNWVYWATLYSEVTCVSYSLISPHFCFMPAHPSSSLWVNPFTSLSPSALFPKGESYSVTLGRRSPCRNVQLSDPAAGTAGPRRSGAHPPVLSLLVPVSWL